MKLLTRIILVFMLFMNMRGYGQNIFRFERIGSEDGLSQNTAFSILFDSKGFMWIGTMNGLNRYDGSEFKIYRSSSENGNNFTSNRVIRLWEDRRGFIWLETYDGYYHFFNPESEVFTSIPFYEGSEIKNGAMQFFEQYSNDIIILGSSESGLFVLKFNPALNTYTVKRINNATEKSLTDSRIKFVHKDSKGDLWIGTGKGLNLITGAELMNDKSDFKHLFSTTSFTAICETKTELWFGTENRGFIIWNKEKKSERYLQKNLQGEGLLSDNISNLYFTRNGKIIAGFKDNGLMIADSSGQRWSQIKFHSRNLISVFEDQSGYVWLTALEFGTTRLDLKNLTTKYYELTPSEIKPLTDLERAQFFEDTKGNLWLGLHGSGLALFNREKDRFDFFRNDPKDPNSISSNFVHCIAEDKSGHLWVGTGQVLGGIEKVILRNSAFEHFLPEKNGSDILDNVARAILEDRNKYLWVATKAGRLHLYDSSMKQVAVFLSLPGIESKSKRNITYSLFIDKNDYLWIGSKGYGLSVSEMPLSQSGPDYKKLRFRRLEYSEKDSSSLGNNNIYSICQDHSGNIWIGTYGNGLNLIKDPYSKNLKFIRINQKNSNLSSNLVRNILTDESGNLWVATTFGLNLLNKNNIDSSKYRFKVFLHNTLDEKTLIYNDIIHLFEDSVGNIWYGSYGGGVDMLQKSNDSHGESFRHFGTESIPGFGIIFAILEDNAGSIWLSSENGLIRLNPKSGSSEIFNNFNGLGFNNFSENTCYKRQDGSLIFGGNQGFEVIRPEKIDPAITETRIELTRFLLFNKEISIHQKDSPLKKSISFSNDLTLKYSQSSFSIDFSVLDFLDPGKIEYSYKLDNFDRNWNNVGNQHRATYTNLPPGRYTFRVKSVQQNGNSTSNERILEIIIMSPWWKTYPAYFVYSLLMVVIGISIFKTITRINRYKNELLIEKKVNEYKLQFFTNISHEIRTPLTLIIGPLEDMLADSDITNKKRLQMEIMLKSARRMLHLTNQLLDFRKVQNNKMVLKISKIDIVAFTREIFNSFVPLANHKGIYFSINSDFDMFWVYADPNKLDTIIYNIISNAIKFTDPGKHVLITISNDEKSNSVDISVTDEGPGISQKNMEDIFTRYTILSNHELAGTGIGLSLSYELAKLHKGNIVVNSVVGKGSTFTIRLLKGREHFSEDGEIESYDVLKPGHSVFNEDIPGVDSEDGLVVAESTDRHMILVVEDNQEILNYICQSLKSFFICIGAKNGSEGLHLARTMNPDVIITDIMMPGIDGMEMTKTLKEDFNTSHIPVIMLTSKSNIRDQIEGIETGAEAYIVKPFSMEYLKTVASNFINQRTNVLSWFVEKRKLNTAVPKVNSKDDALLSKLVKYIEENHERNFSIENLAEYCNISRTVFYNKIRGLTGSSPIDFVRKIKLNTARTFLEGGENVSQAAFKTGFSDVKYFSRLFKIHFGYSPSKHKSEV